MRSYKLIDLVVVSYKVPHLLAQCIESIQQNTTLPYQLYVVDNNSDEGTRSFVHSCGETHDDVTTLLLRGNLGYGEAANRAIAMGTNPFVAVLNNDIIATKGYCSIIEYMSEHKDVGLTGPKLVDYDNKIVGTGVTDSRLYMRPRAWKQKNSPDLLAEVEDVLYVGGSAMFMSRAMLETVQLEDGSYFDPQFTFYFEDFDMGLRCAEAGFGVQYVPLATLIHKHEGSLLAIPARAPESIKGSRQWRNKQHAENKKRFEVKWGDKIQL
jgi:GT2 family glycosyltransferase